MDQTPASEPGRPGKPKGTLKGSHYHRHRAHRTSWLAGSSQWASNRDSPLNDLNKLTEIVEARYSAGCDLILLAGDLAIQGRQIAD